MQTRYRAWMDGMPLDGIDESVIILDIAEEDAEIQRQTMALGRAGQRVVSRRRMSLTVAITIEVHEYDIARRQEVVDRIRHWCAGSLLTTNTRAGKHLRVECTQLPAVTSAARWTDPLSITLSADDVPWWEDDAQMSATASSAQAATISLSATGTAETPLSVTVTNRGAGDAQTVSISCAGQTMAFEGVGLRPGETLTIDRDEKDRLRVRIGDRSAYAARTADSADELLVMPGKNEIACACDQPADWTLTLKGRWT